MGHCKNYAKGNVYKLEVSNTGLLQETRKKSTTKPQSSREYVTGTKKEI